MLLRPAAFCLVLLTAAAANAADKPTNGISGVYLTTRYPALTVRAGETTTIDLSLRNFNHPPQQLALSVPDVAQGWKATILGGGQPVESAIVAPDAEEKLQLRLEPPAGTGPGEYHFLVDAKGEGSDLKLPITVTIGQELPAKLKLTTNFPSLRGTATTSFKFRVTVANDSGRDATINFSADAPKNFQVTFTEAYGSQQLTSIPIEAGKSKDIEASVALPRDTPAGDYKLALHAKSEAASADLDLAITVVGQPRLALAGEGGRLSGEAYAGQDGQLTVVVRNDGSEAARDVDFSATAPEGWKTSFDPKQLPELAAGKSQQIKVSLTPSPRAIAGDYQTTIRANAAGGQSEFGELPHHGPDLDPVGCRRDRGHRDLVAGRRFRSRPLRPAVSWMRADPHPPRCRSAPSPAVRERGYDSLFSTKLLSRTPGEGGPSAQRLVGEGGNG